MIKTLFVVNNNKFLKACFCSDVKKACFTSICLCNFGRYQPALSMATTNAHIYQRNTHGLPNPVEE